VNGDKYNEINSLLVTDVQKSTTTTSLVTANNYLIVDQGNWPSLLCFCIIIIILIKILIIFKTTSTKPQAGKLG